MNPYYSGLGIARSLHGFGVPVYALCSERNAPGVRSRYFNGVYWVPNGRDEPDRFCKRLQELASAHAQRPVIFPTGDFDLLFLQEHWDALADAYCMPQPRDSAILRMMDKLELANVARQLAIATPKTVNCTSLVEIESQLPGLRLPVVVKPRFAYQWRRKAVWQRVGQKAFVAESAAALRDVYRLLAEASPEVLLQEYVAGDDSDIVACCCYIDGSGELLGHFTVRKLRQNPPLIGTGSIIEAMPVPGIVKSSVELLRAFNYAGLAEVEFKHDQASDTYFLIEINPRHWDQHELGNLVGVNLSWIAYADKVGLPKARAEPSYAPDTKHKWVAEGEFMQGIARKLKHELASENGPPASLGDRVAILKSTCVESVNLLRGDKVYSVFRFTDPVPGILNFFRLMRIGVSLVWTLLRRPVERRAT